MLAGNTGRDDRFGSAPEHVLFHRLVIPLAASSLEPSALTALFNAGYSEYVVPVRMDAAAFRDHLTVNDIDLEVSRVVIDGPPVSFALIGRRGNTGWVGGLGTVPGHRRHGHGQRVLAAALAAAQASGCREMWLEVIDINRAAIALYERLGFETVREVTVWSLTGNGGRVPAARAVEGADAHAWIVGNRVSREPWQRADASVAHLRAAGVALEGLVLAPGSDMAAAVLFRRDPEVVNVLQIAALDERSAADALVATAAGNALRLSNAPEGEPIARALDRLGARRVVRQREMRLRL